jgi:hypothetical protein
MSFWGCFLLIFLAMLQLIFLGLLIDIKFLLIKARWESKDIASMFTYVSQKISEIKYQGIMPNDE